MNKQDKLFERIKNAAEKQEQKPFDRKAEVWENVSQKLNPKKRKRMIFYRTISAAAVIAVIIFAGFQFIDSTNPLNENPIINKNIKLNDTQNTEIVDDIKDNLKETEKLDKQYLDSVEKEIDSPKNIKTEPIVAAETDVEMVEDVNDVEDKKSVIQKAEEQGMMPSSVEDSEKVTKDTNAIKNSRPIQIAVLDDSISQNKTLDKRIVSTSNEENQKIKAVAENLISISGEVYDTDGLPIPGVNVVVKGIQQGTQTNFDGEFTIEVEIGQTLQFSYVGFNTKEVKIKDSKDLTITLESAQEALDEVVVSSYKTRRQKRRALRKQKQKAIPNVQYDTEVAQGYIQNSPSISNNPFVRIRGVGSMSGSSSPLYVIDGKHKENLNSIKPEEIKAIKVLKNEKAFSTYGTKGANGVILILTKNASKKQSKVFDSIVNFTQYSIPKNEDYEPYKENPFTSPLSEPLSTFSIDVDRAAYTNIRRFINNGQDVPKDAVRIEEMLNFFEYDYDKPKEKHPFAIHTTYSDAPWNDKHKLLKIALQGKDIPEKKLPASNLVFLIDVSGSMNNQNKLPLVKKSLKLLTDQMRKKDKIALVTYAGQSRVVLEPTSGNQKTKIKNAIDQLSAGGGTYGSQGIETAYILAEENFVKDGNNRVIIATDGDFNIGVTQNKSLEHLITKKRKTNIFLTCLGYGMGNYKDSKMQSLSQKGNGNYAYIDTYQEAQKFLEREFKGSLYAIAKDVKIQIEFNPKHVDSYRLIGYETRMLEDRDFADDTKDAGEIGVNHQVTALYEVIPRGVKSQYGEFTPDLKYQNIDKPNFEGNSDELATVKFRYKPPSSDKSIKIERIVKNKSIKLSQTSNDFKFATAVAWFGLKLRDSQLISKTNKEDIIQLAKEGLENDKEGYRAEFIRLVRLYE